MRRSSVRQWWWPLPVLVSAVLCAGCQSASSSAHYAEPVDACRLAGPDALAKLAPGTVEIPAGSVKAVEAEALPEGNSGGDDLVSCKHLFARDLGGGQPDLQDYRLVTITVVRFTGADEDQAATAAGQLLTGAFGNHSDVRIATGVGDEAGVSERWAAVRTGNVVIGLAIADGGTEAALIPAPTLDNVQAVVTDMTGTLQRDYRG